MKKPIFKLAHKRLEKYVANLPKLLVSEQPETIHQLRVSSRRLQQVLSMLFPKPRSGKSRKVIRSLRNVRRRLSTCRNLDVTINLLQEKLESAGAGALHNAWDDLRQHTLKLRRNELARARKRLREVGIVEFIEENLRLLETCETANLPDFGQSIDQSLDEWQQIFKQARIDPSPELLHALRLAGKRLRYRLELVAELSSGEVDSSIKSLKALQDMLGRWHDRHVLVQFVDDFIREPKHCRDHEDFCRILEAALEAERRDNQAAIGGILERAEAFRLMQQNATERDL